MHNGMNLALFWHQVIWRDDQWSDSYITHQFIRRWLESVVGVKVKVSDTGTWPYLVYSMIDHHHLSVYVCIYMVLVPLIVGHLNIKSCCMSGAFSSASFISFSHFSLYCNFSCFLHIYAWSWAIGKGSLLNLGSSPQNQATLWMRCQRTIWESKITRMRICFGPCDSGKHRLHPEGCDSTYVDLQHG